MVPLFSACCCGCSLRTGALAIGCLSMISAVAGVAIGAGGCVQLAMCEEPHELGIHVPVALALFTMILVMTVTQLVVSAVLLHGVVQGRARLLLPWLVHRLIALAASSALCLVVVATRAVGDLSGEALLSIFAFCCAFFLGVYFLLIVNSHREELLRRDPQAKI